MRYEGLPEWACAVLGLLAGFGIIAAILLSYWLVNR